MVITFSMLISRQVFCQIALMHQLGFSVEQRACTSSSECVRGTSCSHFRRRRRRDQNVCQACPPLDRSAENETIRVQELCFHVFEAAKTLRAYDKGEVDPWPYVIFGKVRYRGHLPRGKTIYSPRVFVEFCSGCIDSDGTYKQERLVVRETLKSMRIGDFVALFVCAYAVGLTIIGELRDIKVCNMAQLRCVASFQHHPVGHVWFAFINAVRLYVLIPQVMAAVVDLALLEGGNTVSLVFNTISVIFVTELDNLSTLYLLSPLTLAKVERLGQVVASRDDIRYLAVSQKLFVIGVIFVIILGVFAEVYFVPGISYFMAIVAVYVESLAELVFYDSGQPLLTQVFLSTLYASWTSDDSSRCCLLLRRWCRCLRGGPRREMAQIYRSTKNGDTASPSSSAAAAAGGGGGEPTTTTTPPPSRPRLMTIATQRQRRKTVCSRAFLQDICASMFELQFVYAVCSFVLNTSLGTTFGQSRYW